MANNNTTTFVLLCQENRRRLQQEAAERRIQENANRGIRNPDSVARQQRKTEEMERREQEIAQQGGGGPTLRVNQTVFVCLGSCVLMKHIRFYITQWQAG